MCLFVVLRLATAIWLQVWVDDGDGMEAARRENASITSTVLSEEEFKGIINNNPRLGFYQLTYGLIIVAMLVFGFFKGAGILITLTRGSFKVEAIRRFITVIAGAQPDAEIYHELPDGFL